MTANRGTYAILTHYRHPGLLIPRITAERLKADRGKETEKGCVFINARSPPVIFARETMKRSFMAEIGAGARGRTRRDVARRKRNKYSRRKRKGTILVAPWNSGMLSPSDQGILYLALFLTFSFVSHCPLSRHDSSCDPKVSSYLQERR